MEIPEKSPSTKVLISPIRCKCSLRFGNPPETSNFGILQKDAAPDVNHKECEEWWEDVSSAKVAQTKLVGCHRTRSG